jgi:hypothetical protein
MLSSFDLRLHIVMLDSLLLSQVVVSCFVTCLSSFSLSVILPLTSASYALLLVFDTLLPHVWLVRKCIPRIFRGVAVAIIFPRFSLGSTIVL